VISGWIFAQNWILPILGTSVIFCGRLFIQFCPIRDGTLCLLELLLIINHECSVILPLYLALPWQLHDVVHMCVVGANCMHYFILVSRLVGMNTVVVE